MADRIYDERTGAMRSSADMAADPNRKKVKPEPAKPSMAKVKSAETKANLKTKITRSKNNVRNNISGLKMIQQQATTNRNMRESAQRVSNAVGSAYDPKSPAGKMKQAALAKAVSEYKKPNRVSSKLNTVKNMLGRGGSGMRGGGFNINDLNR
jgi:hypothetical protein